jgi:V/A-type H+-transporting ATPase subunit C
MSAPVVAIVAAVAVAGFIILLIPVIMNVVDLAPYMYTNAKIRALEAGLLKKQKLEDLKNAKTQVDCVSVLDGTDYGTYLTKIANPGSEEGLEQALTQHTSDVYSKVLRTVPAEVKSVITDLLKIYDAKNIKMVFRSLKDDKFPIEERADLIVPIGTLKSHILKALVESKTIEEAVSELESTEYGKVISESMQKVEETKNVLPLELAIDKYVYERAYSKISLSKEKNMVAASILLGTKIDILNLKTLLRLRSTGGKIDNVEDFLIDASYNLSKEKLKSIAKAETIDEILSQLDGTSYAAVITEVSTSFKETGSLYQIEKKLDDYFGKVAKQLSIQHGLGLGPALYLITGKEADARKIRMFSSFNQSGINSETGGAA